MTLVGETPPAQDTGPRDGHAGRGPSTSHSWKRRPHQQQVPEPEQPADDDAPTVRMKHRETRGAPRADRGARARLALPAARAADGHPLLHARRGRLEHGDRLVHHVHRHPRRAADDRRHARPCERRAKAARSSCSASRCPRSTPAALPLRRDDWRELRRSGSASSAITLDRQTWKDLGYGLLSLLTGVARLHGRRRRMGHDARADHRADLVVGGSTTRPATPDLGFAHARHRLDRTRRRESARSACSCCRWSRCSSTAPRMSARRRLRPARPRQAPARAARRAPRGDARRRGRRRAARARADRARPARRRAGADRRRRDGARARRAEARRR